MVDKSGNWFKRNDHHLILGSLLGFVALMTYFGWLADQQNPIDKAQEIMNKYPTPSKLIEALNNHQMSCSDLTPEFRAMANTFQSNICKT